MQLSLHILRALVLVVSVTFPFISLAETTQRTDDYVAVSFEAEDYDDKGLRWVHTRSNTAQQEVDPDGNHSSSASGGEYMEVLPDFRVTHDDPFHPSGSLWDAFKGPELTYTINFPEAGRYFVHVRAYSTGSEDNGAHIGLNGDFPPQARRMQWCRGKNKWTWSSAQRDSGGAGSCGLEKTVYLDVPSGGVHEVNLQAREDGVEFDRVVMIKDLSNNTRVCEPVDATQISCKNGGIESADGMVDMRINVDADVSEAAIGDEVALAYRLENLDAFDHATNSIIELVLPAGLVFSDASNECEHNLGVVTCTVDDLEPTAPGESHEFDVELTATAVGSFAIDALVTTDELEANVNNNSTTANVDVVSNIAAADLAVEISSGNGATEFEIGDEPNMDITITNLSTNDAQAVEITYTIPTSARVRGRPSQCGPGSRVIVCNYGVIIAGASQTAEFDVEMEEDGAQIHMASVSSNNELDPVNNVDLFELVVGDPLLAEEADPVDATEEEEADAADTDAADTEEEAVEEEAVEEEETVEEETAEEETTAAEEETDAADATDETTSDTDTDSATDTDSEATEESDSDTDALGTTGGSTTGDQTPTTVSGTTTTGIGQGTSTAGADTEEQEIDNGTGTTTGTTTGGAGNSSSTESATSVGTVTGGTAQANAEPESGGSGAVTWLSLLSLLIVLVAGGRVVATRRSV